MVDGPPAVNVSESHPKTQSADQPVDETDSMYDT